MDSVEISTNKKFIISRSVDNLVKIFNLETRKEVDKFQSLDLSITEYNRLSIYFIEAVSAVAISDNSKYIVLAYEDRSLKVNSLENGDQTFCYAGHHTGNTFANIDYNYVLFNQIKSEQLQSQETINI